MSDRDKWNSHPSRVRARKNYAKAHPEKMREYARKYQQTEKGKQRNREYQREWRKKHPGDSAAINARYISSDRGKQALRDRYLRRRSRLANIGTHAEHEWKDLLESNHYLCSYCDSVLTFESATRDHILPIARGGDDSIGNIAVACLRCNRKKWKRTPEEFRLAHPDIYTSIREVPGNKSRPF